MARRGFWNGEKRDVKRIGSSKAATRAAAPSADPFAPPKPFVTVQGNDWAEGVRETRTSDKMSMGKPGDAGYEMDDRAVMKRFFGFDMEGNVSQRNARDDGYQIDLSKRGL